MQWCYFCCHITIYLDKQATKTRKKCDETENNVANCENNVANCENSGKNRKHEQKYDYEHL